jgi:uncharacterized protein
MQESGDLIIGRARNGEHAKAETSAWPAYAFIPGGPWPHPGHGAVEQDKGAGLDSGRKESARFRRGLDLFQAGYYWEAHEVWEELWHAQGRRGPAADVYKALIKLAAAGVKVRQRQPHGVIVHATRAAALFAAVAREQGASFLGLDLARLATIARAVAAEPPADPGSPADRVVRVFTFEIEPAQESKGSTLGPA